MDEKKLSLFRSSEDDATPRFVDVHIGREGELIVSGCDVGDLPMEVWGDEDYEFWVSVPEEQKDWVLLYLLQQRFGGDDKAVSSFKEWLKERGIPFQFNTYI